MYIKWVTTLQASLIRPISLWILCNCTYNIVSLLFFLNKYLYEILFQLGSWWEEVFVTSHCSTEIEYRCKNINWCTIILWKHCFLQPGVKTILNHFIYSTFHFRLIVNVANIFAVFVIILWGLKGTLITLS